MNLLLIGPCVDNVSDVRNFSGAWAYYLARELRARGVGLRYDPQTARTDIVEHYRALDLTGIDHVLALGLAYLDRLPKECVDGLKARCRGMVAQMHDRPSKESVADLTFGIRSAPKAECYHCIGWAADPELCQPGQSHDRLTILIDHPDYVRRGTDRTLEITRSALDFAKGRAAGKPVVIRSIRDGGVDDSKRKVARYHRGHIPYVEMCREYSRADIFMVTHPESVGLTTLECAMAGALVVTPKTFIADEFLATIRHVSYEGKIPWGKVMAELNIEQSRQIAMANSWSRVADRIMERLC